MSDPEEFLLDHLSQIEQIVAAIGRRNGLDPPAIEELAAEVKLRLVADDYATLRAFQGRSSFGTYISAVIARLLLDQRNHEWGKWHASAEAERLGGVAIALEQLLYRDCRTLDETFFELKRDHPELSLAEVDALVVRLPRRLRRHMVGLGAAADVADRDDSHSIVRSELAKKVSRALSARIEALSSDDQLLLRLRFDSGMTVAQIARALQRDPQELYRRLYKLFRKLKNVLESAGIDARDVADLIGSDAARLDFRLRDPEEE